MARNGSGTYSLPAGNPVTTGAVISSTWANNTLDDIATALTASLAKDGQTTPTANLPMATYKHTGVGTATATTDYARADQVQNSALQYLSSVSGADTITASASITPAAYAAGQTFRFISAGANTGAATLNVSSLGAKSIKKQGTNALAAGDIASGALVEVTYDGTNFQLTTPSAAASISLSDNNTWTGIQSFTQDLTITGAGKGVIFEGTTADAYETTLVAGEPTADRTVTMPDATTTLAGLSVTQTFTAPQRGTRTTDNDCSFDLSVTNLWKCTPTAGAALTFTNHADGQSGSILFINGSNYAITAAATTKVTSSFLATISVTGTYIINYTDDGTNTYCSTAGAMA